MKYFEYLLRFHKRINSKSYKLISLILGGIFFLVILPAVFIFLGRVVENYFFTINNATLEWTIVLICIPLGLFFLFWTTFFQWKMGQGTPAVNAPTEKLVTNGPYKLCRNPIEFGAIFYYLGIGTLIDNTVIGIICMFLGFAVGTIYHKFIEEKELQLRFGKEYEEYKKNTPFLLPKIW